MKKALLFLFATMLLTGVTACNQGTTEEENPNPNANAAPGPEAKDKVGSASVGAPTDELSVNPNGREAKPGSALGGN